MITTKQHRELLLRIALLEGRVYRLENPKVFTSRPIGRKKLDFTKFDKAIEELGDSLARLKSSSF